MRANHGAPLSTDPEEWRNFLQRRALVKGRPGAGVQCSAIDSNLRLQLLRAQVGKEEAVQKLRELELKRKRADLVPMAAAEEVICKVLRVLRPLLDSLPKLAAQDANPSNPEMAEEALREGLEKVHQMIDNHLNDKARLLPPKLIIHSSNSTNHQKMSR